MPFEDPETQSSKKRKTKRACDVCRRKKIGCDGPEVSGGRCSNCVASSSDCSYTTAVKKRINSKEYVAALENRLDNMEKLLQKFCPDVDYRQLDDVSPDGRSTNDTTYTLNTSDMPVITTHTSIALQGGSSVDDGPGPGEEDFVALTDVLRRIKIDCDEQGFFGKSSHFMLIKDALACKNEYAGNELPRAPPFGFKRRDFWTFQPWERATLEKQLPQFTYPPDDLMIALTNIYFTRVNWNLPFLHRPTFEKAISDRLHLRDGMFGSTVLLVCAVASRYSSDPRVFLDGTEATQSCGWSWFEQVRVVRRSLMRTPGLYELQYYCLSVQYLYGSSVPQACWTVTGIGIRLAQEVGAHRRKPPGHKYTVEDELWKRAFWYLVTVDRAASSAVGRPCAIQDEDFDLDFPIECDDEYWENPDPEQAFKQPPGKPSVVACFNSYLKLSEIQGYALRALYSTHKANKKHGILGQEEVIVAELDSALNKWLDSVPEHLRWDPNRGPSLFFDQSATLYAYYYYIQIQIHRPFISTTRNPSPLSFPSLAICTNAARSCCHIVERLPQENMLPLPQVQMAVFTAAIVLLFHIWGGKRAGFAVDGNKGMEHVHKCMKYFKNAEDRWQCSGRCWDILYELACVGDLPLPQPSPPSNKRERDEGDSPDSRETTLSSSSSPSIDEHRLIAGSRRVASKYGTTSKLVKEVPPQGILLQEIPPPFELPMNSHQLGSFPLYEQSHYSSQNTVESSWDPSLFVPSSDGSFPGPMTGAESAEAANQNFMDELFYDQMSVIFSTPFGETMIPRAMNNDVNGMWSAAPTGSTTDIWGSYGSQYQ